MRRPVEYTGPRSLLFSARDAGICTECVSKDLTEFGFSYWHRLHLIRGIEYCPTHPNSRLIRVGRSQAFKRTPDVHLEEYFDSEERHVQYKDRIVCSMERRYVASCRVLLNSNSPLAGYKAVANAIARSSTTISLNGRPGFSRGFRPLVFYSIKAVIVCKTSTQWLASSFPELTTDTLLSFIRALAIFSKSSTERYILACLLLGCWDADVSVEGFHEWLDRDRDERQQPATQ